MSAAPWPHSSACTSLCRWPRTSPPSSGSRQWQQGSSCTWAWPTWWVFHKTSWHLMRINCDHHSFYFSLFPRSFPPWFTSAARGPGSCFCCRTSAFWPAGESCLCWHFMRRESPSEMQPPFQNAFFFFHWDNLWLCLYRFLPTNERVDSPKKNKEYPKKE